MKIIPSGYWLKPFASQINCINSTDAECKRGVTVQECMNLCEKDPECQLGYHLDFTKDFRPDITNPENRPSSACVTIPSYYWANSNLFEHLIDSTNPSPLSIDKGIRSTVFYNEKRFIDPEDNLSSLPPNFQSKYLFTGLMLRFGFIISSSQQKFFLQEDLTFSPDPQKAVPVSLSLTNFSFIDFRTRICKGSMINIHQGNSLLILDWHSEQQEPIFWNIHETTKIQKGLGFFTNTASEEFDFVNAGDLFQLYSRFSGIKFLAMEETKKTLQFQDKKPSGSFFFEILTEHPINQQTYLSWKDPLKTRGPFWQSMNDFLCNDFNACSNFSDPNPTLFSNKNAIQSNENINTNEMGWWIGDLVLCILLFFILLYALRLQRGK